MRMNRQDAKNAKEENTPRKTKFGSENTNQIYSPLGVFSYLGVLGDLAVHFFSRKAIVV
jgi:hypothetical protein